MSLTELVIDGQTAIVTMQHPEKHNVLCRGMIQGIISDFEKAREQKVRCAILRAEPGVRVWSAGHDVADLPKARRDPLGWSDGLRVMIRSIEKFPAPVIGLIEGGVWGGACELAMTCDILVAVPEATFAITPAKLGVPYNISGLLTFMNATSMHMVKEMALTAKPISAHRAHCLGIVNHIVDAKDITAFCLDMARGIEKLAPLAISAMKEELNVLASAHSLTPLMFERVQGLRRMVYDSDDYQEGLQAFQEHRPPDFQGK